MDGELNDECPRQFAQPGLLEREFRELLWPDLHGFPDSLGNFVLAFDMPNLTVKNDDVDFRALNVAKPVGMKVRPSMRLLLSE